MENVSSNETDIERNVYKTFSLYKNGKSPFKKTCKFMLMENHHVKKLIQIYVNGESPCKKTHFY